MIGLDAGGVVHADPGDPYAMPDEAVCGARLAVRLAVARPDPDDELCTTCWPPLGQW